MLLENGPSELNKKTFPDQKKKKLEKLVEFIITRLALQEMLKGLL